MQENQPHTLHFSYLSASQQVLAEERRNNVDNNSTGNSIKKKNNYNDYDDESLTLRSDIMAMSQGPNSP